jgi:hypothetical protein
MLWTCPLCGYQNEDTTMRCMCGFEADESVLRLSAAEEEVDIFGGKDQVVEMPLSSFVAEEEEIEQPKKNIEGKDMDKKRNESDDEIFFKEVDSWKISFSKKDQCIYLATPALQSFRIKITMDDLKGLLDFISEKAQVDMNTKQRLITGDKISELIDIIDKMIEVKKAKFKIKFSDDELQGIADIINKQLKD